MNQSPQRQIIKALNGLESQVDYVRGLIEDVIPEQEWIDTKEFAKRANILPRTVSNYAGKGHFKKIKKSDTGHYLIHISELEKWGQ